MDNLSETIDELASENPKVRESAERALDVALSMIRPQALIELETRLRSSTCSCFNWVRKKKEWVLSKHWSPAAWAIYSFHPNGHIREAAVRFLSAESSITLALPFLLLRLNDWVAQVREAALIGVRFLMAPQMLTRWTPLLSLIQVLRARTRIDHSELFDQLIQLYLAPASEPVLLAAMTSDDHRIARTATELALRLGEDRRPVFIDAGLQSDDPEVRRTAADAVRHWRGCPDREDKLQAMFADRYMPVRRLALLARIDEPGDKRRESLIASLLDSQRSMRQLAQYYLSYEEADSPRLDVRTFYLNGLGTLTKRVLRAAILGVGEKGTAADSESLKRFVNGTTASIAAAAVESVATLAAKENLEFFESLMVDRRPAVIRIAAMQLIKAYQGYSVERLRAVVQSGPSQAARCWALRVLTSRHPFEAFVDIVLAAKHVDPAVRELALARARALSSYHRIPRGPSDAEVESVRKAIQTQAAPLPPEIQHIVHKYIGVLIDK